MKIKITKKQITFLVIFIILGLIAIQMPVVNIVGSKKSFTVLEFFGPTAGMFLGPFFGALSVLVIKVISAITTKTSFDLINILLLLPMCFAAFYFGSKSRKTATISIVCMILFIIHPIGREAWVYTLYWVIPFIAFFKKKHLILNSLGATFTAHAVGSTIYLYAFELPAQVWTSLIPQVVLERAFFAAGIWLSYLVFNNVLNFLVKRFKLEYFKALVNENYLFSLKFLKRFI